MTWLTAYRESVASGRSMRVVKAAKRLMLFFTVGWAVGLVLLLKSSMPGGTGTSTVILYTLPLLGAFVTYCLIKILFLPSREANRG